jgi:hypothetical protein
MKSLLRVFALTLALGVALAATAADRATNSTVDLLHPVQVNGQTLKAGSCRVHIVRNGSDATVTLQQGRTTITAPAKFVDSNEAAAHDSYLVQNDNGNQNLVGLKFSGKKEVLMLSPAENTSPGAGH